jgi:hypothetical protein
MVILLSGHGKLGASIGQRIEIINEGVEKIDLTGGCGWHKMKDNRIY